MVRHHFLVHTRVGIDSDVCGVLQQYGVAVRVRAGSELADRVVFERAAGVVVQLPRQGEASPVREQLQALRRRLPTLPILGLGDPDGAATWAVWYAFDVECQPLPPSSPVLHRFARRGLSLGALPDETVAAWVNHLACQRELTAREVQLLVFTLRHTTRAQMRRVLGITENTLKTQVRGLLRKCGEPSLDALAKNLPRRVEREPSRASTTPSPGGLWCPKDSVSGW